MCLYREQRALVNSHELLEILIKNEIARRESRIILSLWDTYRELSENINEHSIEEDCKTQVANLSEDEDLIKRIQQARKQLERFQTTVIVFERFQGLC